MHRLICLALIFGQLLFASCSMASAGSWEPVDGPYSIDAATSFNHWIDAHIYLETQSPSANARDINLLKKLVKGSLLWAYSYGSTFDAHDFLLHFSEKDESFHLLPLQDGGLLFMLDSGCIKISRDQSSPEGRIFPENNKTLYPRDRWYASVFNNRSEITFYFSAVGPFSTKF